MWPPMNAGSAPKRAIAFFDGQNLFAMVQTAREFGQYPLDIERIDAALAALPI